MSQRFREDGVRRVHILEDLPFDDAAGQGWPVTGYQEGLSSFSQHIPILRVTALCLVPFALK